MIETLALASLIFVLAAIGAVFIAWGCVRLYREHIDRLDEQEQPRRIGHSEEQREMLAYLTRVQLEAHEPTRPRRVVWHVDMWDEARIRALTEDTRQWMQFTSSIYGSRTEVPEEPTREVLVLERPAWDEPTQVLPTVRGEVAYEEVR